MKCIVRVWTRGTLRCEDALDVDPDSDEGLPLAKHIALLLQSPDDNLVEMEFPHEPLAERFIRFGASPAGMVQPIAIDLDQWRERNGG
jgi:hypothetical protein